MLLKILLLLCSYYYEEGKKSPKRRCLSGGWLPVFYLSGVAIQLV